jgi:hypothetical protein
MRALVAHLIKEITTFYGTQRYSTVFARASMQAVSWRVWPSELSCCVVQVSKLHGVTIQKTVLFVVTAMRISNPT